MKITGIVLICDGKPDLQGDIIDINGVTWNSPIPICDLGNDRGPYIGIATLRSAGHTIEADMDFYRPDLPKHMEHLIPSVMGGVLKRDGAVIRQTIITGLELSPRNADTRLKTLGQLRPAQEECKHEPVQMIFSSFCKKCNKTL